MSKKGLYLLIFQIKYLLLPIIKCEAMVRFLLSIQIDDAYLYPILWGLGALLLVLLSVSLVIQYRNGFKIRKELEELDRVRQDNIEYDLVLKAMKLSTWHIDAKKRTLTFDADFRGGTNNYFTATETPLDLIPDLLAPNDSQRVMSSLEDLISGRKMIYEEQYQTRGSATGQPYWEQSFATVANRDEEGMPTLIVGASMRIDDQKQMETALINARNKAEESDRLKTAFIANMGHEIRTPLNAIVGFADLLPVVESEEDRNQLISEIQMNNHKLLQIIDGLVSMSKIEAEAKSLVKAQIDIVPILQSVANEHKRLVDGVTVAIATRFPYDELLMNTDADKLREVIDNLMQNAVKFTLHGTITLGYNLSEGDHVRIWVQDTGKGIAQEDQQRIFERFVKVDDYIPGAGLGLSVVKSHVESLGGIIGLESEINKGSTFWIDLPLM